jgi:hypothetical protein
LGFSDRLHVKGEGDSSKDIPMIRETIRNREPMEDKELSLKR